MPHPIPTINGTRPQAILHPGGNRGADLIETIRLERLQASIQAPPNIMDTKLSPARTLFVPEHHSVRPVRPKTAAAARACAPDGHMRPWAEPKWTRPASASTMRVHSHQALNELLLAPGPTSERPSRLPSPVPHMSSASSVAVGPQPSKMSQRSKTRPQSAYTAAEARQRQLVRDQDQARQEAVARKFKDQQMLAAQQQEQEFQRAWEQFNAEQSGPVAEVTELLRLKDIETLRRANAHCKHWNEEVFDKIHDQIVHELRKREAKGSYNTRWRHAQDAYLKVVASKEMGIFRDIIIPDEYDPLECASKNIKYHSKRIALKDPLKTELTQHRLEAQMVPGSGANQMAAASKDAAAKGRGDLPITMWSKLDATPYGHFNRMMSMPTSTIEPGPQTTTGMRVLGDHYNLPRQSVSLS